MTTPEQNLWFAVVRMAVHDLRHGNAKQQLDARRFFASPWGIEVMGWAGLDVEAVRERLRNQGLTRVGG